MRQNFVVGVVVGSGYDVVSGVVIVGFVFAVVAVVVAVPEQDGSLSHQKHCFVVPPVVLLVVDLLARVFDLSCQKKAQTNTTFSKPFCCLIVVVM